MFLIVMVEFGNIVIGIVLFEKFIFEKIICFVFRCLNCFNFVCFVFLFFYSGVLYNIEYLMGYFFLIR